MENKTCKQCGENFTVTDDDLLFLQKVSPIIAGKTFEIPAPQLCVKCREMRRFVWRNDRHIYKRKSDKTGKEIVSIYSPDKTDVKVWENDLWRKDDWDPMSFGKEFDFSKPFFKQFHELLKDVPRQATNTTMNENSDYSNQTWKSKNLYLCFNVGPAEDCYYCAESWFIKNCVDCFSLRNCEYLYSCFDCSKCFNSSYLEHCQNCAESYFAFDCIGCNNIVLSSGLRNKEFYIENKSYTKEEYYSCLKEMNLEKRSAIEVAKKKFEEIKMNAIRKENNNVKSENCTGDYLSECKDCTDCYYGDTSIGCVRVTNIDGKGQDCHDCDFITEAEMSYDSTSVAGFKNNFCVWIAYGGDNLYSNFCEYSSNCFGCVGLTHKQYCILNKQYTKEDYEKLLPKIIEYMQKGGEWGEFFPMSLSYFCYNETVGHYFHPLEKEEAIKLGAKWQDEDYSLQFSGEAYQPLDDISEYRVEQKQKELLSGILKCEKTNKAYKIMPQELAYYLKHNIPVPTLHPEARYMKLFYLRNPRKLLSRQCDCDKPGHDHPSSADLSTEALAQVEATDGKEGRCPNKFKTTYSPDRPEKVFCEKCYQQSVI